MVLEQNHFLKRPSGRLIIRCFRYLKGEGIEFAEIFIDRTFPEENAPTRKPGTAMLAKYLAQGIDLDSSFVIGDRITDIAAGKKSWMQSYFH